MKARVKATGEIIEVVDYNDSKVTIYRNDETEFFAQNEYRRDEIEFLPDAPGEVTIEGWVARDEDGALNLFDREPERIAECAWAYYPGHTLGLSLPKESFPSVTWESEPKRVKITITPIDQ